MENTTTKRLNLERSSQARIAKSVIDCDIHNSLPPGGLSPYLSERWQEHYKTFGLRGRVGGYYPRAHLNAARRDAWPPLRTFTRRRFRVHAGAASGRVEYRVRCA